MIKTKSFFYFLISYFLFFISLSALPLFASAEFYTEERITYQLKPRGDVAVTHEINLTNNFSNIYPQEYHLKIGKSDVQNISAEDGAGEIALQTTKEGEGMLIKLRFNEQSAGKGKILKFNLSYFLPQFAQKRGQIWELEIPKLNNPESIENLNLIVKAPLNFGNLAYASQPPDEKTNEGSFQFLTYGKNKVAGRAISLAFGEFQIFDFILRFSLENKSGQRIVEKVPLPPDTAYQSVFFTDLNPLPLNIETDEDGNWLASIPLPAGETVNFFAKGQAKIFSKAENKQMLNVLRKKGDQFSYLGGDEFWETDNEVLKKIAVGKKTPEKVYNFVVENLQYDYGGLFKSERKGALEAVKSGFGVCTEFADLFVTLCRMSGIPSRELEGFAFTNDQKIVLLSEKSDILHAWAEYWHEAKQVWVPVDPTWGETSGGTDFLHNLDLGHFVFVIHGRDSVEPLSPGFYQGPSSQKNVEVNFAEQLTVIEKPEINAKIIKRGKKYTLLFKNSGFSPIYDFPIVLKGWNGKETKEEIIDFLPPLGEKEFDIKLPPFFQRIFKRAKFKIFMEDKTTEVILFKN